GVGTMLARRAYARGQAGRRTVESADARARSRPGNPVVAVRRRRVALACGRGPVHGRARRLAAAGPAAARPGDRAGVEAGCRRVAGARCRAGTPGGHGALSAGAAAAPAPARTGAAVVRARVGAASPGRPPG